MMRSLTWKMTGAFLAVGLAGVLLVSILTGQGFRRALDQFVVDRNRTELLPVLQAYYRANGSWNGVETALKGALPGTDDPDDRASFILCAPDGQIVAGTGRFPVGATVSAEQRSRGIAIAVDGATVGWLLGEGRNRGPGPGGPEADFRANVTRAILLSAFGATALALLLGFVLARRLTQPLRELTGATQAVAQGALGNQVSVRSRDELGVLAASFNRMSSDLAHASSLRRQMTADIAHDLRTPLSVLLGYTEALREGKLPPEQEIFDTMHTEAQHLQRLIDDLRTLSLADAGELPLTRQSASPAALLERSAAAYRALAEEHGIELHVRADRALPPVEVDAERFAQVLGNLISNAVRYTPVGGSIELVATTREKSVVLAVQDSGVGINAGDLPHIFDRFYRADSSRQQDGSSGLGLAIAKGIVEAHGGTIEAHSAPGHGTTFTITLPAGRAVDDFVAVV